MDGLCCSHSRDLYRRQRRERASRPRSHSEKRVHQNRHQFPSREPRPLQNRGTNRCGAEVFEYRHEPARTGGCASARTRRLLAVDRTAAGMPAPSSTNTRCTLRRLGLSPPPCPSAPASGRIGRGLAAPEELSCACVPSRWASARGGGVTATPLARRRVVWSTIGTGPGAQSVGSCGLPAGPRPAARLLATVDQRRSPRRSPSPPCVRVPRRVTRRSRRGERVRGDCLAGGGGCGGGGAPWR